MHGDQAELRRVCDGGVKVVHSGEAASERVNTLVSVCLSTRGPAKFIFPACSVRKSRTTRETSVPICHPRQPPKLCRVSSELSYFLKRRMEGPRNSVLPRSAAISGASKKFVGSFAVVTGDKGFTK